MYENFRIEDETNKYKLHTGVYSSASQAISSGFISRHDGQFFSTPEMDNDIDNSQHCASRYKSGFWFSDCFGINPNGQYHTSQLSCVDGEGIHWVDWKGTAECLKRIQIKIRQMD